MLDTVFKFGLHFGGDSGVAETILTIPNTIVIASLYTASSELGRVLAKYLLKSMLL